MCWGCESADAAAQRKFGPGNAIQCHSDEGGGSSYEEPTNESKDQSKNRETEIWWARAVGYSGLPFMDRFRKTQMFVMYRGNIARQPLTPKPPPNNTGKLDATFSRSEEDLTTTKHPTPVEK